MIGDRNIISESSSGNPGPTVQPGESILTLNGVHHVGGPMTPDPAFITVGDSLAPSVNMNVAWGVKSTTLPPDYQFILWVNGQTTGGFTLGNYPVIEFAGPGQAEIWYITPTGICWTPVSGTVNLTAMNFIQDGTFAGVFSGVTFTDTACVGQTYNGSFSAVILSIF